jgi:hypothetical protein
MDAPAKPVHDHILLNGKNKTWTPQRRLSIGDQPM